VVVVDQPVSTPLSAPASAAAPQIRRRAQAGYVLITVLLLAGLIVATTAAYARHTTVDWRQSTASLWVHETRESAQSGVAFARQVLSSGKSLGVSSVTSGNKTISVVVADEGGDKRSIRVDATTAGLGATLEADVRVFGLAGDALPTLSAAAVAWVEADADAVECSGTMTLHDTVITGTLRLARSCHLTLRDVVLHGSIVSEAALAGAPYDADLASSLTLQDGVRIEPTGVLPGCAIVLPDGSVAAEAACSLELHGVVVAHALDLAGSGAIDAQVVASESFALPDTIDRPGLGRTPLGWPAALEVSAMGLKSLAFQASSPEDAEIAAIKSYAFPAE
jgi:hypothetical protein